jgi:hypothetical protein
MYGPSRMTVDLSRGIESDAPARGVRPAIMEEVEMRVATYARMSTSRHGRWLMPS